MFSEDDRTTCEYCGCTTFNPVEVDRGDYTQHFCSDECEHLYDEQSLDEPTPLDLLEYSLY